MASVNFGGRTANKALTLSDEVILQVGPHFATQICPVLLEQLA